MVSSEVRLSEGKNRVFELKVSCEVMKNLREIIEPVMKYLREGGLGLDERCHRLPREEKMPWNRHINTL